MRDISMFEYLAGPSPVRANDLGLIQEYAKQAASEYLGQSQIPLNDSISKIASVEQLSPDQVEMICQEANKLVNATLFKTSENKYTDFDLADSRKILAGQEEGNVKNASADIYTDELDYELSPTERKAYFNDFEVVKTASAHDGFKPVEKHIKKAKMEKMASALEDLRVAQMVNNTNLENAEVQFVKQSRAMLLNLPREQRMEGIKDIAVFCKQAGLANDKAIELATMLRTVMFKQGFVEKTADVKAPEEYISDKLNARIVNGTHPLYAIVETIRKDCEKKKLYEERGNIIRTTMDGYACGQHDGSILGMTAKEL